MLVGRELEKMEAIRRLAFRPVIAGNLQPMFAEQSAQLAIEGPRGPVSELYMLRQIFSAEIVENVILPRINDNLGISKSKCSPGEASRYKPVTAEEWWAFFMRLLTDRLGQQGRAGGLSAAEKEFATSEISDHRYSAIRQAHAFAEKDIEALAEAVRLQLRTKVAFGNFGVVDETLISYTGHDMRRLGIDIQIPGKPHDYGMLRYALALRMLYSGMPILVDFDMRLPSHKVSGPEALERLVRRNFPNLQLPLHIYADSLFAGTSQIAHFRRTAVTFTISFGSNAESRLRSLRESALPFLAGSRGLTYSTPSYVVQLTHGQDAPTCVVSSYWRPTFEHPLLPINTDKRQIALALFGCEASDSGLREHLGIAPNAQYASRAELVSAWLGWNLWQPTPGADGLQYTTENLNELGKPLLKILHASLPNCSGGASKKKETLVKDILQNSPLAAERGMLAQWAAARQSLESVQESVIGSPHPHSLATASYCSNYNLIDRHDRFLYQVFHTNYLSPWNSCLVLTFLFQQVINAYALHSEHRARLWHQAGGRVTARTDAEELQSCADFVTALIRGRIAEKNVN